MNKLRWGVLGVSKFAMTKLLPATQKSERNIVTAVASRELGRARAAANEIGAEKAYGSYERLLADPEIDIVYNPLPNHLHVPWSIRAAEAGKHVLCEKPLGLDAAEVERLVAVRDRTRVNIGEAFMVRTHPQWIRTVAAVRAGEIGEPRSMSMAFAYHNVDAANIRNRADIGGGALMDIGCYPIHLARWIFGAEPVRSRAAIDRDPAFGTDRLTTAVLDFGGAHATFTVSTQAAPYQRTLIFGSKGRIEVEIPVNAPPDAPTRIWVNGVEETFPVCDQYTIQADEFARAVRGEREVPVPLEDSLGNMRAIDDLLASARL